MSKITIYTRQMCGFCNAAINLLQSKEVAYEELDATFDPDLRRQMIAKSGGPSTFPQIFIDDTHVGGCDDLFALERSGALDAMISG